MSPTAPQWSQQHWSSNYKAIFCWERSGHLKTIQEWGEECDKALKASAWPPNPPDPWTFEHSGGIPDSSATHQSTDLWGCPVLFGTRALVVNPLSPVGLEVRPPWNRLIPVRPTVVGQADIWGIWRPCGRLEVVCTFSGRCWSVFAALHRTGWQEGSCRHCWCFISSFVLLKI